MVDLGTPALIGILVACAVVITLAGIRATRRADELAHRTGLGEALFGAALLGGATSLSGIATSIAAASDGHASLAVSNALGGIAVQTVFLAIGDFAYRRANLEHAAASLENIFHGVVLVGMIGLIMALQAMPPLTIGWVHVGSIVLVAAYLGGLRLAQQARDEPMWGPRETRLTAREESRPPAVGGSLRRAWLEFVGLGLALAASGYVVGMCGESLVDRTGASESMVGMLATAVVTSLPELITTLAAIRRGALTLAVAGVMGGNAFDCLFVALSDVAYTEGSIYEAVGAGEGQLMGSTVAMAAVLLLGLLRRQAHGVANIGFEGPLIVAIYAATVAATAIG